MDDVKSVRVRAKIPVKLTNAEIGKKAVGLANLEKRRLDAIEEFLGHKKLHQIRMAEIREQMEPTFRALQQGSEEREIECEKVYFNLKKTVRFLDLKTRAILYERPMNKEELQVEMFEGSVSDPAKETCSTKKCIKCGEEWFGGDSNQICWGCKKLDDYKYAREP